MTDKVNKKNKNIDNVKTYKTYKIFPLHHKIFYICLSVCQRDKITDYLIDTLYHREVSNEIPKWGKADLLDYIVTNVQKKSSKEIEENKDHERIVILKELMNEVNLAWDGGGVRTHLQTYIYNRTHQSIAEYSKRTATIGAFLEIAIENYLCEISDSHYDLIYLAFKYGLKEES